MTAVNSESADLNQIGKRIQSLIKRADSLPDPSMRALVLDSIRTLLELHGQGLRRIMQLVGNGGPAGQEVQDALAKDKLVGTLLLIHGLHPLDLETRLRKALDKVRPYLESHGGNVEVVGIENDSARIRLQGTCKSCPSSAVTLELAVRRMINEMCPDLVRLDVEGGAEQVQQPGQAQMPVWEDLREILPLGEGELRSVERKDASLLVCKVNGTLYAYRNLCPVCGLSFSPHALQDGVLVCQRGHRYNAMRAGISPDDQKIHLTPFPLIVENDSIKVSVA